MIEFLNWLDGVLWGLPLIVLMISTGIYFTVRSGFFQFRRFGWILKNTGGTILNKKSQKQEDNAKGMLSSFEAISTAIGGTVGFGNIAGVATAVAAGGPGAVLWMWLSACLGMILKQVEVTLGCYYRHTNEKGEYYGGPTYYMERGLGEERRWGKLWLIPAVIFGAGIFSTFFVTSSTLTASQVVAGAFKMDTVNIGGFQIEGVILVGAALCVLTYIVTDGGTKKIASLFSKLVPLMSVFYILMGIGMILANLSRVPSVFAAIVTNAFTGTAAIGGFAGCAVSEMIRVGMARSVYSNEAGWGTSPMILCSLLHHICFCAFKRKLDQRHRRRHSGIKRLFPEFWYCRKPAFSFDHGYFYCHHLRRLVYLLSVNPGAPLQKGRPHEKSDAEAVLRSPCASGPYLDDLSGKDK